MPDESPDSLTPAEVAELLGIPPSTLRTYATEFGGLLSPGAQGESAVVGRAFGHRRYSRADVRILSQAKTLVDGGLSYRGARAQLAEAAPTFVVQRQPLARPARSSVPAGGKTDRAAPPPPVVAPPSPTTPPAVVPPAVIPADRVQVVPDPAAAKAIEHLTGVIRQLVDAVEETNVRVGQLEDQLETLRSDAQRREATVSVAPLVAIGRRNWIHRLFRPGAIE